MPIADSDSALQQLRDAWPGRQSQLEKLWTHLSARTARHPLLIHGATATGKTGLVRSVVQARGQPHAYVNAVETAKPKPIIRSIMEQLKGKARQLAHGYAAETRCETLDAFGPALEAAFPAGGPLACVVIDAAEQLPAPLLASLLDTGDANVAWLLISQLAPGTGAFQSGVREMPVLEAIAFDSYAQRDLGKVLALWHPPGKAGQRLLVSQLPQLQRVSRSCEDVQLALRHVHALRAQRQQAEAAATDGSDAASERRLSLGGAAARRQSLGGAGSPVASSRLSLGDGGQQNSLSRQNSLGRRDSLGAGLGGGEPARRDIAEAFATGMEADAGRDTALAAGSDGFQLSQFASVLLVAAYIASRTKEQENRQAFDVRARKRRRTGRLAHDRQTEEAHAAKLKGRHAFGLERLLALFWSLLEQRDAVAAFDNGDEAETNAAPPAELQSAEVLVQVASLVSLRLLAQGSGDALHGAKYTCSVPDALARGTAARLGLELQNYVQ